MEYIGIYELTFDKYAGKQNQIYQKEWWFDKKDIITIRERERERESKIKELRERIAELEAITNRTAEQEAELASKKQELAELERQQSQVPKETNWTLWIVGGIALVVVVGIIIYLLTRNKNKKNYG